MILIIHTDINLLKTSRIPIPAPVKTSHVSLEETPVGYMY